MQLLVGSLSAVAGVAGVAGAKNQSSALSQASESIATSLAQKPTGTGKIPTFKTNSPAPSVHAGAGGQGAKMQQPEQPPGKEEKSLSDQVGELAEQSRKEKHTQPDKTATAEGERQGTVLRERREDEPPNPKKRMWEEPIDRSGEKAVRDEL